MPTRPPSQPSTPASPHPSPSPSLTPLTPPTPPEPPPLRWPSADEMFAGAWEVDWSRRMKYAVRRVMTMRTRHALLREVEASVCARALLAVQPRAYFPVMNHLLDRRLGRDERSRATLASLHFMEAAIGTRACLALIHGQLLCLARLPAGTRVCLGLNGVSFHEGLWSLALVSPDGTRAYSISFGAPTSGAILIGAVQGPGTAVDGLERVRGLTREAEGLRPAWLLLHLLRACLRLWNVRRLTGIDPAHHVKGRFNLRAARLKFDYRAFWRDNGGVVGDGGNWRIPLQVPERPMEGIPSRRRAMYRRRYAMLAGLVADAFETLGEASHLVTRSGLST